MMLSTRQPRLKDWTWYSLLAILALLLGWTPVTAQSPSAVDVPLRFPGGQTAAVVPGQLVVRLGNISAASGERYFTHLLGRSSTATPAPLGPDTYLVQLDAHQDARVEAARLTHDAGVIYAEPVYQYHWFDTRALATPSNDPFAPDQWPLNTLSMSDAWDISTGSPNVVVASIDSGVNASHPDLAGRVLPGYNAIDGSNNTADELFHGTFTAGIMAADGANGVGVAGMCWRCRILPVKIGDRRGVSTVAGARGIRWAVDHGARVINLSWGGDQPSQVVHDAVQYAASKGVVVVAAAGNEGDTGNPVEYPAAFPEVIAVGATDPNDQHAPFSNTGDYVRLSAPGMYVISTAGLGDLNSYSRQSGTSFSAPYVAGLAALLLSINPGLTPQAVMSLLFQNADDLGAPGRDAVFGYGRINAGRAARDAQAGVQPLPPGGPSITFPQTNHSLSGAFLRYWQTNGGLPVFGYPITEPYSETGAGGTFVVQYFERNRFELHPEKQPPYDVLLGRLGDDLLRRSGIDWTTLPKGKPGSSDCQYFPQTGHSICGAFRRYWQNTGLNDPKLDRYGRSLQLWGLPLSDPRLVTNSSGDTVLTQWFERGRFEDHGAAGVLLGLLGDEAKPKPVPRPATDRCAGVRPPVSAAVAPGNCVSAGQVITLDIRGFQPNEQIGYWLTTPDGTTLGTTKTSNIGPTGSTRFQMDTEGLAFGQWFWVFQGTQSHHQSIVYFRLTP